MVPLGPMGPMGPIFTYIQIYIKMIPDTHIYLASTRGGFPPVVAAGRAGDHNEGWKPNTHTQCRQLLELSNLEAFFIFI